MRGSVLLMTQPAPPSAGTDAGPTRLRDVVAGVVACMGLLTLFAIVAIAVLSLPDGDKGPNIVAIASTAIGVIGPIVGAYFGVRSASNAVSKVQGSP
jgi:hypothetical protein